MGAPSTLLNSSASRLYLDFESGAPVVQGCEFSNQYAIQIKDPDIDLSGISGNTYTHATPVVQISGTLDGVQTLGLLDGLDTYQLSTGLTIEAGADLTVSPGITLRSADDDWDINVYGRLEMNGAYLELTGYYSGDYSTLYVRDGGEAELNGCVISNSNAWLYVLSGGDLVLDGCTFSGGEVTYNEGSSGSVNACDGSGWELTVRSDQVWLSDALQLRQLTIDAAAVSSLSGLDLSQNLYLNTPMTISDSTIGSNVFMGAPSTLLNSSASRLYLDFESGAPVVQGCEFSNQYAIQIKDPDIDLSGISGNTYTHATPVVQISGTLDGVQTLGLLDGLDTYQLSTGLTIEAGADLTVSPGITLRSTNEDWDIQVYGRLEMNGAYLELTDYYSGDYSTLYVRDGGEAELNGCAISNGYARLYALSGGDLVLDGCTFDGGAVTYNAGSTGSVNACDGTNWYLTVSSDQVWLSDGLQLRQLTIDAAAVSSLSGLDLSQNLYLNTPMTISDSTIGSNVFMGAPSTLLNSSASRLYLDFESGAPVVQGCEFSNQYAIQIKDPDIDLSGISGNTYTHATPVVQISGTLDGVQTLGLLDGLDTYQLSTGLTIEAGADLTVSPGITLRSADDDWDINVYGRLEMNGAYLELTGYYSGDYSTLYVRDGGEAELNGCVISNSNAWLYVLSGGDLVLDGCTFSGGEVTYNEGSSGSVNACDGSGWELTVRSDQVWLSDALQLRQLDDRRGGGVVAERVGPVSEPVPQHADDDQRLDNRVQRVHGGSVHAAEQLCQPAVS